MGGLRIVNVERVKLVNDENLIKIGRGVDE